MSNLDLPSITSAWMSVLISEKYEFIKIWFDTGFDGVCFQLNFDVKHFVDDDNKFNGWIYVDVSDGSLRSAKNYMETFSLYYLRNLAECNDKVNRVLGIKDVAKNPTD